MKKTFRDLYGTWLLFFYYIKWPIFFGLPLLYLEMDYDHDFVMDILWIYSAYLIVTELYQRFISKTYCDDNCSK